MFGLLDALKAILEGGSTSTDTHPLRGLVNERLADRPEQDQRLVTAIAGLLACVAYADQVFTAEERVHIRAELERLPMLDEKDVEVIVSLLEQDIAAVVGSGDQRWVRDLRELTDREARFEVLEVLVDLAAADDELAHAEVNYLRRLTTALGLTQDDYNAAQARHRDKLKA